MTVQPVAACGLALLLLALAEPAAAEPERLQGHRFFAVMDRNTLTGQTPAGAHFRIYFLPGGRATYDDDGGVTDRGRWWLDDAGDVCLRWTELDPDRTECFEVTLDGDTLAWSGKSGSGRGKLRGAIVSGSIETR